jgi:hypothetical protein
LLAQKSEHIFIYSLTILYLGLHLKLLSPNPRQEFSFILKTTIVGYGSDAIFTYLGGISFPQSQHPPLWLLCIWILFSSTLRHSMHWLATQPIKTCLLFGIAGPLSYYGVQSFELLRYQQPLTLSLGAHGLIWALLGYLFFHKRWHQPIHGDHS